MSDSNGKILGGAATGAATGAASGSMAGPVGTIFGSLFGALAGGVSQHIANKQQKEQVDKANALTDLRNATAMGMQYRQALQLGLNPSTPFSVSPPSPSEANAAQIGSAASQISGSLASGFSSASSQMVSLENAKENREMQERLSRLSAAGQLLGFHYNQTFQDYMTNGQYINDRQMKLKEVETAITNTSSLSSTELASRKSTINEQSQAFKNSAMKADELLSSIGFSLEQAEKESNQDQYGFYANGSLSASFNPFKLLSGSLQVGGKYDHSKTIEQAKKAVTDSNLSKTDKQQALTQLDELSKQSTALEKSVKEMKTLSESVSNQVQRLGFNSYIDMLLEIEDLKLSNEELKLKMTPEYMFKKYQEYYKLNY